MMKSLAVGAALASATLAQSYEWPTVDVEYKTSQFFNDNASVERSQFLFLARGAPAKVVFPSESRRECWWELR